MKNTIPKTLTTNHTLTLIQKPVVMLKPMRWTMKPDLGNGKANT